MRIETRGRSKAYYSPDSLGLRLLPFENDDGEWFLRHPQAGFLVRPWRSADGVHENREVDLDDMMPVTIAFRSGYRLVIWSAPFSQSVWSMIAEADNQIRQRPSLAGGVVIANRPYKVEKSLQSGGCVYVDAPGTFWLCDGYTAVFRDFRKENVHPFWRRLLVAKRKRDASRVPVHIRAFGTFNR